MCNTLHHRGPDDSGYFLHDRVGLGMRRLTILDKEGGRQPMASHDNSHVLVCNGEIYNHQELRQQLITLGHSFSSTHSDTEVLLAMWQQYGTSALKQCNGMFAAAIWNAQNESLHLVRDRLGVKPLYYYYDGKQLIFASEIKAILASQAFTPVVNERAIWDYMTFRYVPGPHTIWKNVYKLPPAHYLVFKQGMAEPLVQRWWDIPYANPPRSLSLRQAAREGEALLEDAVNLRMLADVPVGIMLSGGLDSSVTAALAARRWGKGIKTFSVAFADPQAIDERPFAREVAAHLGTDHHEIVLSQQQFLKTLDSFVYATDEPLADLASIPLQHVCALARDHVTVVLSGEGSDEVLAGYNFEENVRQWELSRKRNGIGQILDRLWPRPTPDMRTWDTPLSMTNYYTSADKAAMFHKKVTWPDSFDHSKHDLQRLGDQYTLNQALYLYCQGWLTEDLLMKADRMSMQHSLELRTPFLDYRFVEWAAQIPPHFKAGQDCNGVWTSKLVLRKMAEHLLPASIITRPKQGFPVPVYAWLAGPLKNFAHDMLAGEATRLRQWFTLETLSNLLHSATQSGASCLEQHRLWNCIILEMWARRWGL